MKMLVTGASGFVAGSVIRQALNNKWTVHGISRQPPGFHNGAEIHAIDLHNPEALAALFKKIKPDVLIHTAALANIDYCERNQAEALSVNAELTRSLAGLCQSAGVKLLHCSTDTVFDGVKGSYVEDDQPHPVNFYGETKWRSEKYALEASAQNIVARLSLVMGLPVIGKGNSFLADLMNKLQKKEQVNFPENEIRTPIDIVTLGKALVELAEKNDFSGLIHLAGNSSVNRFQMAIQMADLMGLPSQYIAGTNSNAIPGRAPRPNNASLNNDLAKKILKTPMQDLAGGLALTLHA